MVCAFIAVGSNIDPKSNIKKALRQLAEQVKIIGISTFYRTTPIERPEQQEFYNGVVEIQTELAPEELKDKILRWIEASVGRERGVDKYAPRPIDLDLIIYDNIVVTTEELVLPDPEINRRPFLAIPLHELAPELTLPGSGERIAELAEKFKDDQMQPLVEFTRGLREEIEHES